MEWCKNGANCTWSGAKTVQIAPWMVQKVVQTRCNLHMFLHLHRAKSGANEVQFAHVFAPTWCEKLCKRGAICICVLHLQGGSSRMLISLGQCSGLLVAAERADMRSSECHGGRCTFPLRVGAVKCVLGVFLAVRISGARAATLPPCPIGDDVTVRCRCGSTILKDLDSWCMRDAGGSYSVIAPSNPIYDCNLKGAVAWSYGVYKRESACTYNYSTSVVHFSTVAVMATVGGTLGICPYGLASGRAGSIPSGSVCTLVGHLPECSGPIVHECADIAGNAHSANASLAYIAGVVYPRCSNGVSTECACGNARCPVASACTHGTCSVPACTLGGSHCMMGPTFCGHGSYKGACMLEWYSGSREEVATGGAAAGAFSLTLFNSSGASVVNADIGDVVCISGTDCREIMRCIAHGFAPRW